MQDNHTPPIIESAIESQDVFLIPVHAPDATQLFAKVDRCDADKVSQHRWGTLLSKHSTYARRGYRELGKLITVYMHTAILGVPPKGLVIDHINGDGLDNRRSNLRFVTRSENRRNSPHFIPRSEFIGIARLSTGRWTARITVEGKRHYLGVFDTEHEAAHAYDRAASEHFGESARLNFPDNSDNQGQGLL